MKTLLLTLLIALQLTPAYAVMLPIAGDTAWKQIEAVSHIHLEVQANSVGEELTEKEILQGARDLTPIPIRVLDVGSNNGKSLDALEKLFSDLKYKDVTIEGIEIDDKFVFLSRQLTNHTIHEKNIMDWESKDKYNFIFLTAPRLSTVPTNMFLKLSFRAGLTGCARNLKEDGMIIVTFHAMESYLYKASLYDWASDNKFSVQKVKLDVPSNFTLETDSFVLKKNFKTSLVGQSLGILMVEWSSKQYSERSA